MDQPDAELLDPERYDAQEEGEEEVADLQAFQREYEDDHSWEMLQEDDQGLLRPLDIREEQRAKRRRLGAEASARIRRGMIRYLQIVVDLSRATSIADMRPSRIAVMSGVLQAFIRKFFDENPLSHIGILVMRNGKAKRLTELSGSPEAHISKLRESLDAGGDASLQNALDMAVDALKSVPPYGHREVLVLFAALSTCDPGEINDSIQAAKKHRCRVSIVGIAAEVYVCRRTTEETGGTYGVALNDKHLEELVLDHAPPPPAKASDAGASLVRMGFPKRNAEGPGTACFVGEECKLEAGGFTCPKCRARVHELPSNCHVCGLTLVSSPHLARSYHHLFPVKPFVEVAPAQLTTLQGCGGAGPGTPWKEQSTDIYCYSCLHDLAEGQDAAAGEAGVVLRCADCQHLFCFDCDAYIHESLHNCPGCECLPQRPDEEDEPMVMETGF